MTIAWFSCGCTSAVACRIALNECKDVRIFYIDTGGEHEDNRRFLSECEDWFGQKITVVRNEAYKDHLDCLEKKGWGPQGASCTLELKKKLRWRVEEEYPDFDAQVFGFDLSESTRARRFLEQYPVSKAVFPLIQHGLTKEECLAIIERVGITPPAMYRLGYHNNNCIGCLKGGLGYWNKIRREFPSVFARMAKIERKRGFAAHKEQDGSPLFLDELSPDRGESVREITPECGLFCEVESFDLLTKKR